MKIGLYLQDYRYNSIIEFNSKIKAAKSADLDLLVFPETGYTPQNRIFYCNDIESDNDRGTVVDAALDLSERLGCAVILGADDSYGTIYNVYANAFAKDQETEAQFYYKHTMADFSPMEFENYPQLICEYFRPIKLKDKTLGMTICYDCNHSAFSRAWGKQKVDIIINSTGGNVVYKKWYKYNKARALENNCFDLCTMGYWDNGKGNSYTFGFTPNGRLMENVPLFPVKPDLTDLANIYMYDTNNYKNDSSGECDLELNQTRTLCKNSDWEFKINQTDDIIKNSKKIDEGLYIKNIKSYNVVFIVINEMDIILPENVLKKMYHKDLQRYANKKYIILNRWKSVPDKKTFENKLSVILKVRAMENYCTVVFDCPTHSLVLQTTDNRQIQVIDTYDNNSYALDFKRMGGPETIWKNKNGMKAAWRIGYESIIDWL